MSKPLPATLVTRLELAEHFKVSIRTVSVWDKLRLIPRIKVGHVIRYNLKSVIEAITNPSMNDLVLSSALCAFQDLQMAAANPADVKRIETYRVLRSVTDKIAEIGIANQSECPDAIIDLLAALMGSPDDESECPNTLVDVVPDVIQALNVKGPAR